jgi:hypothetical protein
VAKEAGLRRFNEQQVIAKANVLIAQNMELVSEDPFANLLHSVRTAASAELTYRELWRSQVDDLIPVSHGMAGTQLEPHPYYKMWIDWTDRLAKFAKMAIDAGIAKQIVDLEQKQAEFTFAVVLHALERLHLDDGQRQEALLAAKEYVLLSDTKLSFSSTP